MKIRILHIYWGDVGIGGMEKIAWYLAKEMNRNSYELYFCYTGNGKGAIRNKIEDLGWSVYTLNAGQPGNFSLSYYGSIFKIVMLIKKIQPHILHTWDTHGNLAGRIAAVIARVPILIASEINRSDRSPLWSDRILCPIERFFNKLLDPFTDRVICDSEDIRKYRDPSETNCKFQVIYCPFDSERFLTMGTKYNEMRSQNPDEFVLGIVARLDIQKGHRYLLQAMPEVLKRFSTVKLLIVGKEGLEENLKKQARSLGISENVVFKGEIVDEVPEFLCSLDLFVHPSLFEGGGPTAVLEAMAIGLPVVASNIGGINESVVDGETGILVPSKNPHALAQAIIELLSDKTRARQMGLKGRGRVSQERFQLSTYIKTIENLYEELVTRKIQNSRYQSAV